jgi:hypothetical protein
MRNGAMKEVSVFTFVFFRLGVQSVCGGFFGLSPAFWGSLSIELAAGAGRYTDEDGNVLMGRWENNVPREGIMEWVNGEVYDGWWSGKCEATDDKVDETGNARRCGKMASFGPADGMRCFCYDHKKDSHMALDPYLRDGHGTMK